MSFSIFKKGFEIGFSKSVLFRVSQKLSCPRSLQTHILPPFLQDIYKCTFVGYFVVASLRTEGPTVEGPKARPFQRAEGPFSHNHSTKDHLQHDYL